MKRLTVWLASTLLLSSGLAWSGTNADALFSAVRTGDPQAVKAQLDKGMAVNARDKQGRTPLIVATMGTPPVSAKLVPLWKEGSKGPHVARLVALYKPLPHSRHPLDPSGLLTAPDSSPEVIKLLLDRGADVNAKDNEGETALMNALYLDDADIVGLLLDKGADPNAADRNGETVLTLAIESQDPALARLLLGRGANVNARDNGGRTPLMAAIQMVHPDIARLLLRMKANVDARDNRGNTALIIAAENTKTVGVTPMGQRFAASEKQDHATPPENAVQIADTVFVEMLLDNGADVNAKNDRGETALMQATQAGALYAMQRLLAAGAEVDARDAGDQTALMIAVIRDNAETTGLLLEHGADPNAGVGNGIPLLQVAVDRHNPEIVRLLLDKGANVDAKGRSEKTAWDDAISIGDPEVIKQLLAHGANPNAPNIFGDTALTDAICHDQPDFAAFLLAHGADVNLQTKGQTPLLLALNPPPAGVMEPQCWGMRNPETVQLLLEHGADPNAEGPAHETPLLKVIRWRDDALVATLLQHGAHANPPDGACAPLIAAIHTGDAQIIKLLREKGADIDVKDRSGQTALMRAAQRGDAKEAALLLQYGANPAIRNAEGKTALDIARQFNQRDAITLLESPRPAESPMR